MKTLSPAYGRDYKSKAMIQIDLRSDKDFILNDFSSPWNGKPINRAQLLEMGEESVLIRYGSLRKIAQFSLK